MARQRRHNRKRRSRGRFRGLYQMLSTLLAVGAIVIGCIVFFRVQTITVEGNSRYTAEEIISISGIQHNDYLVLLEKSTIARSIRSQLPYVESVSIRRSLPDSVLILVEESPAVAALEIGGKWWLINGSGKLLESTESASTYAVLTGLSPLAPTVGELVLLPEEQSARWEYAKNFLAALQELDMLDGLISLDCSKAGTFAAEYEGGFSLIFPSTGNFTEYLSLFHTAVSEELKENETGIFDFTHYETTGYVHFRQKK